ncbi:MAG: hypothetical protein P9L99_20815 [Candidatus Lernaella stagnicola]|nr:hypothetical protein [Candidatus Lernaella stagnicola]
MYFSLTDIWNRFENFIFVAAAIITVSLFAVAMYKKFRPKQPKQPKPESVLDPIKTIVSLEKIGFIVEKKGTTFNSEYLIENNFVICPLVPTPDPNVLHLLFAHVSRELSKANLRIVVLLLDSYYYECHFENDEQPEVTAGVKQAVEIFKKSFESLYSGNTKIIFELETTLLSKKSFRALFLKNLLYYFGCKKMGASQGNMHHDTFKKTPLYRHLLPVLNFTYLETTKHRFGITLAGLDDKKIWDCFSEVFKKKSGDRKELVNVYIPPMKSIFGTDTHALDREGNFCLRDDRAALEKKVLQNIETLDESVGVFYLLKWFIFPEEGSCMGYTNFDLFLNEVRENKIPKKFLVEQLAALVHKMFHGPEA